MATGDTFVTTVEEGLNTMIASARSEGEYPSDVMIKLVDRDRLMPGTGISWREALIAKLTAQNYGETAEIDNPQEYDISILSATPQLVAIQTWIGRRVEARLSPKAFVEFGGAAQRAMNRKMDTDLLAIFATATTTNPSSGTLTSGHIAANVQRIASNTNEPGEPPIYTVLHGYGIFDLRAELTAGVGTYPIPEGYTKEVFSMGYSGSINSSPVYVDGLISVSSTPDARGGVFAKRAIVFVEGFAPWTENQSTPWKGYGGQNIWLKHEYVSVERSAGNWLFGVLHDATAPTG